MSYSDIERKTIFNLCVLNSYFGTNYPKDIIIFINKLFVSLFKLTISCGCDHSAALTHLNEVYVWGGNYYGQLGLDNYCNQNTPQKLLNFNNIKQILCKSSYSMALTNSKEVYIWGSTSSVHNIPQKLALEDIKEIFGGNNYSVALTYTNDVFTWVSNEYGQFGLGDNKKQKAIKKLPFPQGKIKQIACGGGHLMILTYNNQIYVWGFNKYGQLGLGDNTDRSIPQKLAFPQEKLKQIVCGSNYSMILTNDNQIYAWGSNNYGQLGIGDNENQNTPQKLPRFCSGEIKQLIFGSFHTMALTDNNEIYVWGRNEYGQLGLGDNEDRNTPQKLSNSLGKVHQIICGGNHSMAITFLNEVYMWGHNKYGQLGLGDNYNRNIPTKLNFEF